MNKKYREFEKPSIIKNKKFDIRDVQMLNPKFSGKTPFYLYTDTVEWAKKKGIIK